MTTSFALSSSRELKPKVTFAIPLCAAAAVRASLARLIAARSDSRVGYLHGRGWRCVAQIFDIPLFVLPFRGTK